MTPPSKQPGNILDLRKIIAEQSVQKKRDLATLKWPKRSGGDWHKPKPTVALDWVRARREAGKFLLVGATVAIVVFGITIILSTFQSVQVVMTTSTNAVNHLEQGMIALNNLDQPKAKGEFSAARDDLSKASRAVESTIGGASTLISHTPFVGGRYVAATKLITAANNLAESGILASSLSMPAGTTRGFKVESDGLIKGSLGWLQVLSRNPEVMADVQQKLVSSYEQLSTIKPNQVPGSIRSLITTWQQLGPAMFGDSQRFSDLTTLLLGLIGSSKEKNYLFVFENDDELRPAGGFPGTYALVKFDRGTFSITDSPGNGPYALTDATPKTILPPDPLLLANSFWTFQDAGWFIDQRVSAAAMGEFYRLARGIKPDGVIFVTTSLIEQLLTLTGPITIDSTKTTITSDNFLRTTEQQVEFDYDKQLNAPKQMLVDLIPLLLSKISTLSTSNGLKAMVYGLTEANRGNLLVTSNDEAVSAASLRLGWDGSIDLKNSDYLAVVDTNIGGGKTDRSINVEENLKITPGVNTWDYIFTITRRHIGKKDNPLTGFKNTDFIRVLVPAGATFVSIDGASVPEDNRFKTPAPEAKASKLLSQAEGTILIDPIRRTRISHESGGTVIGFWSTIGPGEKQEISVHYTVPTDKIVAKNQWSMIRRRQPGSVNRTWTIEISAEKNAFKPAQPETGWQYRGGKWVWSGPGDWTTTFAGVVKTE